MKIGREVIIEEDFEIEGLKDKKQVKKGDKGFVDSRGFVHYLTGEARGKMQKIDRVEMKGYDTGNIAEIILIYLNYFGIKDMLNDYDIDKKDFKEKIEEALDEIF